MIGVDARAVDVEVHLSKGMPGFDIVGLPETAVRESRVRVRAALANQGFALPQRRVTLNLAPADLRKRGASLDLAIAVALLSACGTCAPNDLEETLLFGELSLSGELRVSRGLLPQLRDLGRRGLRAAIVPRGQLEEAALVRGVEVRGAHDLRGVVAHLNGEALLPVAKGEQRVGPSRERADLMEVRGQEAAKRALEIAAAGAHHLLLIGPPGAGKTMLARRLSGILPRPTRGEALSIATIASAAGLARAGEAIHRPFRAPHHTASAVALVGGGDPIRPGEVTLAHGGVLFLDELPEFARSATESFRVILESGVAVVARARERVEMPAKPLVVAAMNPCPCGFDGDPTRLCSCTPARVEAYRARVSGPMLDRFALHVALPPVRLRTLREAVAGETSAVVRARVEAARAHLEAEDVPPDAPATAVLDSLPREARELLIDAGEAIGLSMRGFTHAARVGRTIAALEGSEQVRVDHVAEALGYRVLDRASSERSKGRSGSAPDTRGRDR